MTMTPASFSVVTKNGIITKIGKTSILQPKIRYTGRKTKWLDDSIATKNN